MKSCCELAREFTYWDGCQWARRLIYLKDWFSFSPLSTESFWWWHESNDAWVGSEKTFANIQQQWNRLECGTERQRRRQICLSAEAQRRSETDKEEVRKKWQMQFQLFAKASTGLNCFFTVCWLHKNGFWWGNWHVKGFFFLCVFVSAPP